MCGLVGIIGQPSKKLVDVFGHLLQIDVIRGPHSTGMCAVTQNNYWQTLKDACLPQELLDDVFYRRQIDQPDKWKEIKCLMGHNRYATKGAVSSENAHPFHHSDIIMMHNGTILNVWELIDWENNEQELLDYETDSEVVCHQINAKGIEWTWEHIDGAAALAFWNAKNHSLNLIRNSERPLYFAYLENRKYMMYASEIWMIEGMAKKHNLSIQDNVWQIQPNYMFTFRWNKKKNIVTSTEKKLIPFVKPVIKKSKTSQTGSGDKGFFEKYKSFADMMSDKANKSQHTQNNDQINYNRSRLKDLTEEDFKKKYDKCVFCDQSVKDEFEECLIIDDETAACNSCATVAELENIRILH